MSDTATLQRFEVKNRFTGDVQFTAEIECAPDSPISVKLGLAVRWAIKTRADLAGANLAAAYLAGANLADANLADANLAAANLADANLADANLVGADLAGANLAAAYLADANLAAANLAAANLADANLVGAYLAGANLVGAYLAGANLAGAKIKSIVAIITRITGGFTFYGYDTDQGLRIFAGCRNFSPDEYRAHVAKEYPDIPKAAETLAIIAYIEARHAALREGEQ